MDRHLSSSSIAAPLPAADLVSLRRDVAAMLEAHWQDDQGYTAPNDQVYPWQWLWDSCFHALVWTELGRADRALRELEALFSTQGADGFVPHMNYQRDPQAHADFWGRSGRSSITQPPMYGHALAMLVRRGVDVPTELLIAAERGLRFLLERRARDAASGLVLICHPWETGCDNSPRWDVLLPNGFDLAAWRACKGELVASITPSRAGSPVANSWCPIASVAFNALVIFNALELAAVHSAQALAAQANELALLLDKRWDAGLGSWIDAGIGAATSGAVRTAEALLPLLVTDRRDAVERVLADLVNKEAYGTSFGPAGVHPAEPVFDPDAYWRGSTWPQINYLLWVAAAQRGNTAAAKAIAVRTVAAAIRSGLAEYWNPLTGEGRGAIPQSWTGVALLMARAQ